MNIKRIEEFKLTNQQHQNIGDLLKECFSAYPADRSFYKQLPSFRFLVSEKKIIIAHLALSLIHI